MKHQIRIVPEYMLFTILSRPQHGYEYRHKFTATTDAAVILFDKDISGKKYIYNIITDSPVSKETLEECIEIASRAFPEEPSPLKNKSCWRGSVNNICFVMGLPRSGTTFLMSLLSTHPNAIPFLSVNALGNMTPQKLEDHSSSESGFYFVKNGPENLKKFALQNPNKVIIEKTPRHTLHLSEIQKQFPCARYVFSNRSIFDVIESMIYTKGGPFPYTLDQAIRTIKNYAKAMNKATISSTHPAYENLRKEKPLELATILWWSGLEKEINENNPIIKTIYEKNRNRTIIKNDWNIRKTRQKLSKETIAHIVEAFNQ